MDERSKCPVCGETSLAEQIDVGDFGGFPTYMDGTLHCPNEHDDHHVTYWVAYWLATDLRYLI